MVVICHVFDVCNRRKSSVINLVFARIVLVRIVMGSGTFCIRNTKVFGLKRDEMTAGWKKQRNECDL